MTYNAFLFPEAILDTPRLFTAIAEWLAIFVYFNTKTNQWVREGGLFVIVSNLITVLNKYKNLLLWRYFSVNTIYTEEVLWFFCKTHKNYLTF